MWMKKIIVQGSNFNLKYFGILHTSESEKMYIFFTRIMNFLAHVHVFNQILGQAILITHFTRFQSWFLRQNNGNMIYI